MAAAALAATVTTFGQTSDPKLALEAAAVRSEVARSMAALRHYTWTEQTQVLVKGDVKSTTNLNCRYDENGQLLRAPIGEGQDKKEPSGISKRAMVRKKAEKQDYIERAVSMIQEYVPPKPEQISYLLQNGGASFGKSEGGTAEIVFKDYYQRGDSMVFTYDAQSKQLLRATVNSTLGSPKDPVTMLALFEMLPEGINHLASATVEAKAQKIQVTRKNLMYQKAN
jgi:hypothetical protein